jgi:hypothetical protein
LIVLQRFPPHLAGYVLGTQPLLQAQVRNLRRAGIGNHRRPPRIVIHYKVTRKRKKKIG